MTSGLFPEILAELNGEFWVPVGTLFTVEGTGVADPFGPGFSGDIARGLMQVADGLWGWQPIGYQAAVFPMGPSVAGGVQELAYQISRYEGKIALSGYSQGAIVVDKVWRDLILNPNGALHHRLNDVVVILNFGDPLRCPGIANGNKYAGIPLPKTADGQVTGGIAGKDDLKPEETPDFLLSFALDGDLYACCPVGQSPWTNESSVGRVETNIYDIIQQATFLDIISIAKDLVTPIGTVEAIINGLTFAAAGTNAPHWQYGPLVGSAVDCMVKLGNAIRAGA